MFSKYAKTEKGALTLGELFGLMHGQKCAGDLYGVSTADFVDSFASQLTDIVGSHIPRVGYDMAFASKGWESLQRGCPTTL